MRPTVVRSLLQKNSRLNNVTTQTFALFQLCVARRKIILIESNAKCYLKKLTCKGALRQVFICLRHPPLLGFCLGQSSNFVGSESGHGQSDKLLQNIVYNTTQQSTPLHPLPATHSLHLLYFDFGKGGGVVEVNQREGQRGKVHKAGSKIPT